MNKEEFIKLLSLYEEFLKNCRKYYKLGIDLHESKFPTWTITEKLFDIIIEQNYNKFGIDWIQWFVYETDFQKKKMGAWDEETLICQSVEELYDYIEKYKK